MKLKIVNKSNNPNLEYATLGSAGMDLRAYLPNESIVLRPLERAVIPTGIYMQIEDGHEGQIRPRSGLAAKQGLTVINAPGTIDSDYTGEIGVPIVNLSNEDRVISGGDRIAQIVFAKFEKAMVQQCDEVSEFTNTERGAGGFGSTGTK